MAYTRWGWVGAGPSSLEEVPAVTSKKIGVHRTRSDPEAENNERCQAGRKKGRQDSECPIRVTYKTYLRQTASHHETVSRKKSKTRQDEPWKNVLDVLTIIQNLREYLTIICLVFLWATRLTPMMSAYTLTEWHA